MRMLFNSLCLLGLSFLVATSRTNAADDFKPDDGFTAAFNGKDLTGWKAKGKSESFDGKTEAFGGRFKVADGIISVDPAVKGDVIMETAKTFGKDVTIKFDFKPGEGCNNDLFLRKTKFDIKTPHKNIKLDDWNSFEIILKGDMAEFKCNGEKIGAQKATADATSFGIRAEFKAIQFRRIQFKE
ncbi:MAG: DUF1080 domain-containing protein [Planctomycetes bacterium]|nr:DUF1080 domain-containing protein [Planctomycetota bacterium]